MLGLIFTSLNEMIEDSYGLSTWNEIVREANIPDNGAFTLGAAYPDEHMGRLAQTISNKLNIPMDELLRLFGKHVFSSLANAYPEVIEHFHEAKDMLMHVDDHIHKEIAFYHPQDAGLPTFTCHDTGEDKLTMIYNSPRKLCYLAEGVIQGVAHHFNCGIDLVHSRCVHKGDDACTLELTIHANE